MGRRRFQQPSIFKTDAKRPMWYFRARVDTITTVDGKPDRDRPEGRYYIGFCSEMTKQDAKKRRDEILSEVINRPQFLIPSQVRLAEVLKIYRRDHLPNLRETTREVQESALRRYFEPACPSGCKDPDPCQTCGGSRKNPFPAIGGLRMCDVDALAIQRWISSMALAHRTRQGYLALLRIIWRRAEDWGYTQQPFPRGKFTLGVNRSVKGREMPTMEQLRRLLASLEDPYRAMAEVALYSGLRISEIRGLKWEDISAETLTIRRRISIRGVSDVPKSTAGNRSFDVRPLAGVLARMPRTSEWVFDAGCYSLCLDYMQAARKAAGITVARFGWHHLRACFNTLARSSGADSIDRQALMGHTTDRMNAVYVMQDAEDLKRRGDLMLAVQAAVMGETKGKVQ
jgi:integrase